MAGRKIFVGSLPDGVQGSTIRAEFAKYGDIEDVFVKPGCGPGRQWAFVTYATVEQATRAKDEADRILMFPGAAKACDVMLAKNQGKFGQAEEAIQLRPAGPGGSSGGTTTARKVFVGSLPDSITEAALMEEFSKYGQVEDVFLKLGCQSGKQWAFVTFQTSDEALNAKNFTDKTLTFPGSERPCEVMIARNQGMNGQDPVAPSAAAPDLSQGPVKVFVGSLPDNVTEALLRSEFSKYGQITDVYLKLGCEPGKQWAFITFATHAQAQQCKELTDRSLVIPGATSPVEVMFARNQGKHGQDPLTSVQANAAAVAPAGVVGFPGMFSTGVLGLPGAVSMPAGAPGSNPTALSNGGWITYFTPAGLPYYHNHITNVTQWECPAELQMVAMSQIATQQQIQLQAQQMAPMYGAVQAMATPSRVAPY